MPTVAISADFLTAYSQIPRKEQKKVREFTEKFRSDPTTSSINYEPIKNMLDPNVRTVRIGLSYPTRLWPSAQRPSRLEARR